MKKSKKTAIQIMYETVMENGGVTGPFSKAVVDAYEGKDSQKESTKDKKIIIQFKKQFN